MATGTDIPADRARDWIDGDLVEDVERVPDEAATYNLVVRMSGIFIHVIKREPGGPLVVGQEMEFDDEIRDRIRGLPEADRGELVARVREALMEAPVVYGFRDDRDRNVAFDDVHHVFVEGRIYPDEATQQRLMDALVGVWKSLRYLDDIWTLMDAVER